MTDSRIFERYLIEKLQFFKIHILTRFEPIVPKQRHQKNRGLMNAHQKPGRFSSMVLYYRKNVCFHHTLT